MSNLEGNENPIRIRLRRTGDCLKQSVGLRLHQGSGVTTMLLEVSF
jgi:hypothetical protein